MTETSVVVVGGGPAGLSSAVALGARSIDSIVFDAFAEVGDSWRRRYDSLHLHTHRRWSGLAHGRLPRSMSRYPSRDEYADWLGTYAADNEVDVRLASRVDTVRRDGDHHWITNVGDQEFRSRTVVVATGLYGRPLELAPSPTDSATTVVHASTFRHARHYPGGKALVVGVGNSGAEIAAELAANDRWSVALAVRTPPPIRRRDIAGIPSQTLGILLSALPVPVAATIDVAAARVGPDLTEYGLGPAGWEPFRARRPPVIDAGLIEQLRAGRIEIVPALERLTPEGARLVDGTTHTADLVVLATGYEPGLESLLPADLLGPDGCITERATHSGLHAVGFDPTMRGQLYEIRVRSLRMARMVELSLAHG